MTEITATNWRDIKFTRDTVVNYKDGNAVINCIFRQYDTDENGKFNDVEWANYQTVLLEKEARNKKIEEVNNKVFEHYNKKLEKVSKNIDKLYREYGKLDYSCWDKLLEFEKKHTEIGRYGYLEKSEVPQGAMEYDISNLEMGIYDEEMQSYTGESYKKGYLLGLESLSKEERKEYLSLLDKASKVAKKYKELDGQCQILEKEFDKYYALQDMAACGIIDKVGSNNFEELAYQKYVQIRSESNPFYKEIKDLEQKREALRLKGNQTEQDFALIQQYKTQLEQLKLASAYWTISDSSLHEKLREAESSTGFKTGFEAEFSPVNLVYSEQDLVQGTETSLTNTVQAGVNYQNKGFKAEFSPVNLVYSEQDLVQGTETSLTNTVQAGVIYQNKVFKADLNASLTQNMQSNDLTHSAATSLGLKYQKPNWEVGSASQFSIDENQRDYKQRLLFRYKNWNLDLRENIITSKSDWASGTTHTTSVNLSHNIKNFSNSASAEFAEEGNTYSLSSNANFNKHLGEKTNLSINPNAIASYNDNLENYKLVGNLGLGLQHKSENWNAGLNVFEQYSTTIKNDTKPQINNNLTTEGNVSYKGLTGKIQYTNSYSSDNQTNTYGVGLSYKTKDAGTFSVNYSYQNSKDKFSGNKTITNTVLVNYSLGLDGIGKKGKEKEKGFIY